MGEPNLETSPEDLKASFNDTDMYTIVSKGNFISVSMSDDGDISIQSDSTGLSTQEERKIVGWIKKIRVSPPETYYSDGLYRTDLDDKILIYKLLTETNRQILAGYILNKDNTTRINLMDVAQRRIIRALK